MTTEQSRSPRARPATPRGTPIPPDAELVIEFAEPMPPLINGAEIRRHGMHAWCCARGLCVPVGLHADFKDRLGTEDAHARLKAWYPSVVAKYEGQPVGDDLFDFWRHEFAGYAGVVTAKPTPVNAGGVSTALRHHWRDECAELHGGRCESSTFHNAQMSAEVPL